MFVMTIDQQNSRTSPDAVPGILEALAPVATVVPFARTIGDEVQGVLDDPAALVAAVRRTAVDAGWHIGIGIGAIEGPLPKTTAEGRGPAFYAARRAVEAAKSAPAHLSLEAEEAEGRAPGAEEHLGLAEAALRLLASALTDLRPQSRGYVGYRLDHPEATQAEIALRFDVSQQAVSRVLATGIASIVAGGADLARHHLDFIAGDAHVA